MEFAWPTIGIASLLLIPLLAGAAWWVSAARRRDLAAFGQTALTARLTAHLSPSRRALKLAAGLTGAWLLAVALAGPLLGVKMVEVRRQGVDVLIALDVSKSMLAEDIKPSRLERAKQELGALIDRLDGDRVGVIAFAGSAHVACPLTTDYAAAKMFLSYVQPDSAVKPGTALGEAIRLSLQTYPPGSEGYRVLVLLTDGEDHGSQPLEAAREAKAAGVRLLTIGFGSPQGEPIPVRGADGRVRQYVKTRDGKTVVSRLNEGELQQLAGETEGAYVPARQGSLEAERVAAVIAGLQKRDVSGGRYGAKENRFQWALLPAWLLVLAALWLPERRGAWLAVLLLLLWSGPALAGTADEVNAGNRAYRNGKYDQALEKYGNAQIRDPDEPVVDYNRGNALYRKQEYEKAAQAYERALRSHDSKLKARALYNLGNTAVQRKQYREAVDHYRQALRLKPRDEDTLYNLGQAMALAQQPPQGGKPQDDASGKGPKEKPQAGGSQAQGKAKHADGTSGQEEKDNAQAKPGSTQSDAGAAGPDDRGRDRAPEGQAQTTPRDSGQEAGRALRSGDMRPEEAERILDAVRESERAAQEERRRRTGQRQQSTRQEDW